MRPSIGPSFISDGQRTYDPARGMELKVTGVDKEQLTSFRLDLPEGPIFFAGYPTLLKEDDPRRKVPSDQLHVRWEIYPPGASATRTAEANLALVAEALSAYGYGHGAYPTFVEVALAYGVRFP